MTTAHLHFRPGITRGLALCDDHEALARIEAWMREVDTAVAPTVDRLQFDLLVFGNALLPVQRDTKEDGR